MDFRRFIQFNSNQIPNTSNSSTTWSTTSNSSSNSSSDSNSDSNSEGASALRAAITPLPEDLGFLKPLPVYVGIAPTRSLRDVIHSPPQEIWLPSENAMAMQETAWLPQAQRVICHK
jgi:hypothetical protein